MIIANILITIPLTAVMMTNDLTFVKLQRFGHQMAKMKTILLDIPKRSLKVRSYSKEYQQIDKFS